VRSCDLDTCTKLHSGLRVHSGHDGAAARATLGVASAPRSARRRVRVIAWSPKCLSSCSTDTWGIKLAFCYFLPPNVMSEKSSGAGWQAECCSPLRPDSLAPALRRSIRQQRIRFRRRGQARLTHAGGRRGEVQDVHDSAMPYGVTASGMSGAHAAPRSAAMSHPAGRAAAL